MSTLRILESLYAPVWESTRNGRRYGHAAVQELERLIGRHVHATESPGLQNATAALCGSHVWFDPSWFGSIADDPYVGPAGVRIIVFHEGGHLVDCENGPGLAAERFADRYSGFLSGWAGYSSGGIAVFRR